MSAGPPQAAGSTSPNPPATQSDRSHRSHGPGLAQRRDLSRGEPELGQDGVGVLADRRDRAHEGGYAAGADRRRQRPDRAGRGADLGPAVLELRMSEQLTDGPELGV